ncbi:MAG: cytochrome c3 family protein [Candidatus Korobacteraceae bacterium]
MSRIAGSIPGLLPAREAKALLYLVLAFAIGFASLGTAMAQVNPPTKPADKGKRGEETQRPAQQSSTGQPDKKTGRKDITGDVIGMHNLSPGSPSPIQGPGNGPCLYCHVPHSASNVGLWNQTFSTATYTTYTSTTLSNRDNSQLPLGADSNMCLSCHDGTVAVADTVLFGQLPTSGNWIQGDNFSTQLQSSHPFSLVLPLKDNIDLISTLVSSGKTGDKTGAIHLINGSVECNSCHSSHVQAIDKVSQNFLALNSSGGTMCLACHDPTRTSMAGQNQVNPMAGWATGIHATAQNTVSSSAQLGSYGTVAANACISCHAPHNAAGAVRLLRGTNEAACLPCHNGSNNLAPVPANIAAEYAKIAHPFPNGSNQHDAAEAPLLQNNRHATCVDCHNSHGAQQVTSFNIPPLVRVSQTGAVGISMDGTTVVNPVVNQYENCLRCHGYSAGKQINPIYGYLPLHSESDPLNVITQMNTSAKSSHPVMHTRSSSFPQPSLLPTMLDLSGGTNNGRSMGSQIFCTDCHNADDNREFGGVGPNGPHGSKWWHLLERQYLDSQAPGGPGTLITINLNPSPDLSVNGPYGMCAKCHNLSIVMQSISWAYHNDHVYTDGFSCSTCHNAHGMPSTSDNPTGVRMVDFDLNVVGQNNGQPISYNQGSNSCVLTCHNVAHDPGGGVHKLNGPQQAGGAIKKR